MRKAKFIVISRARQFLEEGVNLFCSHVHSKADISLFRQTKWKKWLLIANGIGT